MWDPQQWHIRFIEKATEKWHSYFKWKWDKSVKKSKIFVCGMKAFQGFFKNNYFSEKYFKINIFSEYYGGLHRLKMKQTNTTQ